MPDDYKPSALTVDAAAVLGPPPRVQDGWKGQLASIEVFAQHEYLWAVERWLAAEPGAHEVISRVRAWRDVANAVAVSAARSVILDSPRARKKQTEVLLARLPRPKKPRIVEAPLAAAFEDFAEVHAELRSLDKRLKGRAPSTIARILRTHGPRTWALLKPHVQRKRLMVSIAGRATAAHRYGRLRWIAAKLAARIGATEKSIIGMADQKR